MRRVWLVFMIRWTVGEDEQGSEWGRLDPNFAPPSEAATKRCLEVCHGPEEVCRGSSVDDILRVKTSMNYHPIGAWLATMYDPRSLMSILRTSERVNPFERSATIHGSAWQWTYHHIKSLDLKTIDDARKLAPEIIANAMEMCEAPTYALEWACAHGIGHASVVAAAAILNPGAPDHISCTGPPTVAHSGEALQIAESICAAMPHRDLGYACADGLYMSWAATECPPDRHAPDMPQITDDPEDHIRLITDVFAVDPMVLACANASFVPACIFGAVVTLIETFYTPRSFHGFDPDGARSICADPFPVHGIVNRICQAPVWFHTESLLRSCLYGAAWAISDPHWCFSGGRQMYDIRHDNHITGLNIPAWCANITDVKTNNDDDYAARVAACVLAPLYHVTAKAFEIETATNPDLHRPDLVTSCQTFCADLATADDPVIRAVAPICATNLAICASLDGEPVSNASFVPTNLFEHVHPGDDDLPPSLFVGPPHRDCGRAQDLYKGGLRANFSQ